MNRVRVLAITLVASALSLSAFSGCSPDAPAPEAAAAAEAAHKAAPQTTGGASAPEPTARRMAPDFELVSLSGESIRIADLRGKTVVIDFWATWCPPCEFQVPELNAFYAAHRRDADVTVLGISVDVEGPEVVGKWVDEMGVQYRVLLGGEDVARAYGAVGFPTLYIIAPNGEVDSVHVGLIETGDLEAALARQRAPAS